MLIFSLIFVSRSLIIHCDTCFSDSEQCKSAADFKLHFGSISLQKSEVNGKSLHEFYVVIFHVHNRCWAS